MKMIKELLDTKNRLLIIGPHPDDAEFSTGRLMLRRKGQNIDVVCMTDGRKGQDGSEGKILPEADYAKLRIMESRKALREFHIDEKNITYLMLPDQDVVSNPFIIDRLFMMLKRIRPDFVLLPPWEGAHPDHDATHLFMIISLRNAGFDRSRIIEYGSYNNYGGSLNIQEFIPHDTAPERLAPTVNEQRRWRDIMKLFRSQVNQQRDYFPKSCFENFRILPRYDYAKLPYSDAQVNIIRELFSPIYPLAKKAIPRSSQMFYETWTNIDPNRIKDKLKGYIEHYGVR
jgi:LmbE family N-acetylglucosaminyl deacetylase